MKTAQYTLSEVEQAMQKEGIGRSSTRYVIETLQKIEKKDNSVTFDGPIRAEVKEKPYYGGVKITPFSTNNVTFEHKGEVCQLHFMTNGKLAISRESNKDCYLEIDKDQLVEMLLKKF